MMLIWIRLPHISELKDATEISRTPSIPFEILAATAPSNGANHLRCSRLSLTFQWGAHSKWMAMDQEPRMYFQSALYFGSFSNSRFCLKHCPGRLKALSLWMNLTKGIDEFWELSDEDQLDIASNFSAWSQRECKDPCAFFLAHSFAKIVPSIHRKNPSASAGYTDCVLAMIAVGRSLRRSKVSYVTVG